MKRNAVGIMNGNWRGGYYLDLKKSAPATAQIEKVACVICGQEVEAKPMKANTCYTCYRDGLELEARDVIREFGDVSDLVVDGVDWRKQPTYSQVICSEEIPAEYKHAPRFSNR